MAKVIILSRQFPGYHPKAGQPTYFVEKFWNSLYGKNWFEAECPQLAFSKGIHLTDDKKHHTIRAGSRFKVGDKFSPRVWSGKPYKSKQIIIAPDTEIKKIWNIDICNIGTLLEPDNVLCIDGSRLGINSTSELATNDGLSFMELLQWFKFPKPFKGQIICWNESVEY